MPNPPFASIASHRPQAGARAPRLRPLAPRPRERNPHFPEAPPALGTTHPGSQKRFYSLSIKSAPVTLVACMQGWLVCKCRLKRFMVNFILWARSVDFHIFFMDFHSFSWIFMDFHDFSWIFMIFHGVSAHAACTPLFLVLALLYVRRFSGVTALSRTKPH